MSSLGRGKSECSTKQRRTAELRRVVCAVLLRRPAALLLLIFAIAGCGGTAPDTVARELAAERTPISEPVTVGPGAVASGDAPATFAPGAPSQAELEAKLISELERLGVDPNDPPLKAPSGEINGVVRYRRDFLPQEPVQDGKLYGLLLVWEEQLAGDYDGNGIVGISDLSPIGMYFQLEASYYEPELVEGISNWPHWDSMYEGMDGIGNWLIARADGDSNGEVNIGDIVPIAQNFGARADSYRVYRRDPGELEFTMVPNKSDPEAAFTVRRLVLIPGDPYGESFIDGHDYSIPGDSRLPSYAIKTELTIEGETQFYLAPYDSINHLEGEASQILSFHSNKPPVLVATVSTQETESPTVLDVDASLSNDPDSASLRYYLSINGQDPFQIENGIHSMLLQESGAVEVRVSVHDHFGAKDEQTYNLNLPFNGQRSVDWQFTVLPATGDATADSFAAKSLALIDGKPALAYSGATESQIGVSYLSALEASGAAWGEPVKIGDCDWGTLCVRLAQSDGQPVVCYVNATGLLHSKTMFAQSSDLGVSFSTPELAAESFSAIVGMADFDGRTHIAATGSGYLAILSQRPDIVTEEPWPAETIGDSIGAYCWLALHGESAIVLSGPGDLMRISRRDQESQSWQTIAEFEQLDQEADLDVNGDLLGIVAKSNLAEGMSFISADLSIENPQLLRREVYSALPFRETGLPSLAFIGGKPVMSFCLTPVGHLVVMGAADERGEIWLAPEEVDSSSNASGYAPLIDMDGHPALVYYDKEAECLVFARRNSPL